MIGIFHSRDNDGFACGAIIKHKYPDAKLIGYDYGQPFDFSLIKSGEPVIMADVSMPMPDMLKIAELSGWNFTFIDHHITAINDYKKFVGDGEDFCKTVFDTTISACEGTWKHLFPNKAMPKGILLLGEYDTWRNQDKNRWDNEILPFQFGMRMICNSAETFSMYLFEGDFQFIVDVIEKGKIILKYQAQVNEVACKSAFEYEFEGLRAICLNVGGANSDVFKSVYDESKHDIMIPFKYDGKSNTWIFSFYTTKPNIDCSALAKKYGGGGHRAAAGCNQKSLSTIFKNHINA